MTREDVEHLFAVLDPAAGGQRMAQHHLRVRVVLVAAKDECHWLVRPVDRPSGQRTRDFLHVLLRIAAVHPERVELHQLARVVLVQPAPRAEMVVEVVEHRRAVRDGP